MNCLDCGIPISLATYKRCRPCNAKTRIKVIVKICQYCNKQFRFKYGTQGKFCSYQCYWSNLKGTHFYPQNEYKKGQIAPMKGRKRSDIGERHHAWKGNNVGYHALHRWIGKKLGTPDICEHCNRNGLSGQKIQWANKSGEYKRDLEDWIRLCRSCHIKYDNIVEKSNASKKIRIAYKKGNIPVLGLAAGYGTRLYELTKTVPKPMLTIANKPIAEHILINLSKHNLRKYIINLHYLPEKVSEYIGDRALYFFEPRLLGHVGTIRALKHWLIKEPAFFVINFDTISNVNFEEMLYHHKPGMITALMQENRAAGVWIYPPEYFYKQDLKINPYRPNGLVWFDCGTKERLQAAKEYYEA